MTQQDQGRSQPPVIELTPEEDAELAAGQEEIARGELATDERMRAIRAKRL